PRVADDDHAREVQRRIDVAGQAEQGDEPRQGQERREREDPAPLPGRDAGRVHGVTGAGLEQASGPSPPSAPSPAPPPSRPCRPSLPGPPSPSCPPSRPPPTPPRW